MLSKTALIGSFLAGSAVAETVHGVLVFSRHGDRTTKHYGAQSLTSLGAQQCFEVGSDYRSRYLESNSPRRILDISEDKYVSSQVYASAPDQGILLNTATAFLQGLYPPLVDLNVQIATSTLNNGSTSTSPLNGYQYVLLHGENSNSPDTIWIKGDDGCPANAAAYKSFEASQEFQTRVAATKDFYAGFYDVLESVYDYKPENMTYKNAYDIFDLVNVARIHNSTSLARNVTDEELLQLRTLADSAEFGYNFNASQSDRSIHARTLTAGILAQLNQTVASEGKLKFSLLSGSYDTFLAFFGLTDLIAVSDDFYGLPDYASTMAFELVSDDATAFPADVDADLRVRFLFQNGTSGELITFPLFGTGEETILWPRFVSEMQERAISTVEEWCSACSSLVSFCAAYQDEATGSGTNSSRGMSNAVAGVIGAAVTLGVVALAGGIALFYLKRRRSTAVAAVHGTAAEKSSLHSEKSV
ncbi:tether containing UBX domain for glut4 [Colletotrichum spaethianum]|uniref:Tether containing UBX domain for glut4 n=1 Tax=Colletotrichum spaethianum TaxID=700344 RepID=A0AA37P8E0_9PEZI|nr:tether containing UBX domain for glut4 [Colletotrichum spaethianum]GKT47540.1 tether containing UBX domain for glut4 [Colletotrichum spaethianum]